MTMKRTVQVLLGLAASGLAAMPQASLAQDHAPWHRDDVDPRQQRNVAGDFDYYALVLSWSPTYCSTNGDADDAQCNRRDGKRFAFVLHGLWPQYRKGYPASCRTPRRPYVPQPLIDSMLDVMPSPRLVIHEYRKHGTCSGLPPEAYFGLARRLFVRIRVPERYKNPTETQYVAPGQLISELVRLNPDLRPDMVAVSCGGPGNRLRDVRICYSREGRPIGCGTNEDQRRLCRADQMFVPPVRSTARDYDLDGPRANPGEGNQMPLPRPRVIEMFKSD